MTENQSAEPQVEPPAAPPMPAPQGLQKAFTQGEMIPLKGIWFEIEDVSPTRLRLQPKTMTAARRKEIHNGRR
jgi:hypothetical protein